MSYDISLAHPVTGKVLILDSPHQMKGGTYEVGGSLEASLNITYNYAPHYYKVLGDLGIRTIYGLSGAQSMPLLDAAIGRLGGDVSSDYWEATEGNAKTALLQLMALALLRPDGIWDGD